MKQLFKQQLVRTPVIISDKKQLPQAALIHLKTCGKDSKKLNICQIDRNYLQLYPIY
jgi:hypothetical protein